MPPVKAPAKVLVTGASGFVAVWVCKTLLEQGYHVVGTVRSTHKGEYLQKLFEKDGFGKDRFSFMVIEDMVKDGAFDEAVASVDAVEHTASPVSVVEDPQALIVPAVKGTTGILKSIKEYGKHVKRVVITSSATTVLSHQLFEPDHKGEVIMDESSWNTTSPKEVEEKGKDAPWIHKYRTSKILAEQAAWRFMEDNKNSIAFDLVTVIPTIVYGPILHDIPSAEALNMSIKMFLEFVSLPDKSEKELLGPVNSSGYWADVRDVATIHALALANPNAGGERFIACSGPNSLQDFLDAIHASEHEVVGVSKGLPGQGKNVQVRGKLLTTKVGETFGFKFRSVDDMAPATIRALRERGF
ncbi:methylglyoxal reductase (NADPH-dependent) gre2 [Tulasnella sp. JGI-2019a]|nr:methylglyoxal reductase (NADPH-dependent) gre2 [Tulasnella sp. JGI-2019a]